MTYILHLIICIGLILFQTTILHNISVFRTFYDFLIPYIIFLGVYRSLGEGMPLVFLIGFMMDSLSGGPFGVYSVFYFWLYICLRWLIQYLHADSFIILPATIAVGIFFQNALFGGVIALMISNPDILSIVWHQFLHQLFWAAVTGPLFLLLFKYVYHYFSIVKKLLSEERGDYDV